MYQEQRRLRQYTNSKSNIFIINIICFEYILLDFDLTRNTGFEVSKSKIGDCWIKSCCEWEGRQNNDICGLDGSNLPIRSKMKEIYYGTSLYRELSGIGMEVQI